MVYGNSNSNDDDDGQWTIDIDMVIFLLSTWRSILNNSSDNNISSINAKRLDMFILLDDCNGALSLVVIFVGVIVIVGWSLMIDGGATIANANYVMKMKREHCYNDRSSPVR